MSPVVPRVLIPAILLFPGVLAAQAVERYELSGDRIAIYNLAGSATVEAGAGSAIVVEVRRQGADAQRLEIQQGAVGDAQTLRVVYPAGNVVFDPPGWSGRTDVRVRADGTFGDGGDRRDSGRRVRISSEGSGTRAWADLRILVPAGRRVAVYLAVGPLSASGVAADLRLDGGSGKVTTARTSGSLLIDVGSGAVEVRDHQGDGAVDTGSGSVLASGMRGDHLVIDTGSGAVTLTDVTVDDLRVDTGSGSVTATGLGAPAINIDTGSGGVDVALTVAPRSLVVDTGSGSVTVRAPAGLDATLDLETSSGDITVDFALQISEWQRNEVRGTVGGGSGHVRIETGSGSIAIRKL